MADGMGVLVRDGTGVPVLDGTGGEGLAPTGPPVTAGKGGLTVLGWEEQPSTVSASTRTGRRFLRIKEFSEAGLVQGIKTVQLAPPSMVL